MTKQFSQEPQLQDKQVIGIAYIYDDFSYYQVNMGKVNVVCLQ